MLAIGAVLAIASLYVPGSLRQAELDSSLASGAISMESIAPNVVVDLPYHLLQRLGFIIFGVSTLTIKLPSIILGLLTSIGIFLLIRTWSRRSVAILTTILATTTTQFLFLIQDGTPSIMFCFLTIWTLFAATYVMRKKTFSTLWKALTGVLMAAALYTPLGIYLVLAILTTAFFHPHIRHTITHFARPRLIIAILFCLLSIVPLVYASILDYHVALRLIGFPSDNFQIATNAKEVFFALFGFTSQSTNYLLRPVYSLGAVLLIAVGIYKLLTYKYTARSYIALTLGVLMIPLIIFNPSHITDLFPLAVLMIALGIAALITNWYKLFPHNPYARVAGLIPLAIVVGGIVLSGILRYMNNYQYNPDILKEYSSDLRLIQNQLGYEHAAKDTTQLTVSQVELPFYSLVAHYDKRFSVGTDAHNAPRLLLVTHAAHQTAKPAQEPTLIITNRRVENADRLYVYNTPTK